MPNSTQTFGRWPWSWPVDVPVRIRMDRGFADLTERGVIYDLLANVGKGYTGTIAGGQGDGLPPWTLTLRVARSELRKKLRSGEWTVVP